MYPRLGEAIPAEFMLPNETRRTANIRLARDRATTTQTTTGREVAIAPGDISAAQQCVESGGKWNPIRYNCDRSVSAPPTTLKPPIQEQDPYAQQRANCAMRTGFVWNPTRNACESSDPYVDQKNRCALMGGIWNSRTNTCDRPGIRYSEPTGPTIPVPDPTPQEPFLPDKEPDVSVLDQTQETNEAPISMIDPDRSSGGGSGVPQWMDRQEPQGISINLQTGKPAASRTGSTTAPKWLIPAIIGAAMLF